MDEPDRQTRIRWAQAAGERLRAALDTSLGERLARGDDERPAYDEWVRVSGYDLGERCLARWAGPGADDYEDTARTVARRMALRALARRGDGEPVAVALDRELADPTDWQTGLWSFWEGLDRAGRAAVHAAAVTWAVGALTAVRGRRVAWVSGRPLSRQLPGRRIELRANWDASAGGVADPTTLVIVTPARPGPLDRYRAGHAALVAALGRGCVPPRVRHASPVTGRHRAEAVTPGLLDLAVDRVVELALAAADPDSAPATPGGWCRTCHLLPDCPDGRDAIGADPLLQPATPDPADPPDQSDAPAHPAAFP